MASVLSRLSILLHADTASFRRDMDNAQSRLGRFGVGAKQAMKVAAVGIAAGAATATVAIAGIAKEQMAAAAEFERFAQLSNTNAVEFQKLAAGAAKYGIEALAQKDVPAGKPYKIIDASEIPADRSQRNAWTVDDAALTDGVGAESNTFPEVL